MAKSEVALSITTNHKHYQYLLPTSSYISRVYVNLLYPFNSQLRMEIKIKSVSLDKHSGPESYK